jgi:hypothetical protein
MWYWRRMEKISWTDLVKNEKIYIQSRNTNNKTKKLTGFVTHFSQELPFNHFTEGKQKE